MKRTSNKLLAACLGLAACGPADDGGSGSQTGTETTGETTTGGSTGTTGATDSDGGSTGGAAICEQGTPAVLTVTVDPGTWPSEPGIDDGYTDYTLDTACTVSGYAPGATGFVLELACTGADSMAHVLTMTVMHAPMDQPPGLSPGDAVDVRFYRDSWQDVTQAGAATWVSVSEDGVLLFAAVDGRAEFLPFTPAAAADFWSPLTPGYGDPCADDRRQLDMELAGTHLLVPHGEWGTLVTGEGEYLVIVDTMTSEDQGPEYPSVDTFRFGVVRKGP